MTAPSGTNGWTQVPMGLFNFGSGGVAHFGSMCGIPISCAAIMTRLGMSSAWINQMLWYYEQGTFPTNAAYEDYRDSEWTPHKLPLNNAPKAIPGSTLCHSSITTWRAVAADWIEEWENTPGAINPKKDRCGKLIYDVVAKTCELINAYAAGDPVPGTEAAAASVATCTDSCHDPDTPGADVKGHTYQDCTGCHTQEPGDGHNM